jgi:dienelactone hydrolase
MAEILLLHHALGLTTGVHEFAGALRDAGHTVHAPDLFGRTFATVEEGADFEENAIGWEGMLQRTEAAADGLPADLVYVGMSLGVVYGTRLAVLRPGARGLVGLYSPIPPEAVAGPWPAGVPAQYHWHQGDPWVDEGAPEALVAQVPDAEIHVYEGETHLFADPSSDDFDATATALAMERILAFLTSV